MQASETELRVLLAAMQDIVLVFDTQGRYVNVASTDPSLLYTPASERIGKTVHEVLPRELADTFLDCIRRALRTCRTVHVEYSLWIGGRYRWFSAVVSPMSGDKVVWVARDSTERKEAEEALKESERRFKQLFEQSADTLLLHDESGRMVDCNSEACRSLGYSREELLSLSVTDFATNLASDGDIVRRLWQRTEASGLDKPVEGVHLAEHRRKDGTTFPVEVRVSLIDYGGKQMMLASARDISGLKRAAEALKESEERFRGAFEDAPVGVALVGLDRRYLRVNRALCEMLGYSEEELLEKTSPEITHPEDLQSSMERTRRALEEGGGSYHLEKRYVHADGSVVWVLSSISLVRDAQGNPDHFVSLFQDVTERKRSEELLRQQSAAMTASMDGVAILDESGAYAYLNEAHVEIFGYDDPEELLGKSWKVLYDEGELERLERDVEPVLWENGQWRGEAIGKKRDGSTFPQEVSLTAIEGGGHVCVVRNVTERKRAEEELRESEERFRAIFDEAAIGISIADPNRRLLETNQAYQELVGYSGEELYGKPIAEISHPDDPPVDDELNKELLAGNLNRYQREKRYVRKDGEMIWVRPTISVVRGAQGEPRFLVGMVEDITERKQAESKLRESEEKYRTLVEQIPAIIYVVDLDNPGVLAYVSPQMETILGYSSAGMFDFESWVGTIHPDDRERLIAEITRNKKTGGRFRLEYRQIAKDGRVVWFRDEAVPVRDAEGRPRFRQGVRLDITERKALEEQLEHQALHDALTDLPNRTLFMDRIEHALARARRREGKVAVLFVDLDNFKFVNDTLGHRAGDQLLVAVSNRLRSSVRPEDTIARMGGDEFAVLLEDTEAGSEAARVAERMIEELRAPFDLDGQEVFSTPSIGIAFGDSGQDLPETLLRKADVAMYRAKEEGKARHRAFDRNMEARTTWRLRLENDLRRALERGEFEVCYQPVVHLETQRIVGFEALARWKHPERGTVYPDEFVPLAEEIGLIIPLGRQVLRRACRQAQEWQERYPSEPPLIIGVNLSAKQLKHPDLIGNVQGTLRETGLDPERLTLEITEGSVVRDEEHSIDTLRGLRDLGVRFALDDFGTGYSSLSYLKRLPVEMLKIDRSFVERIGEDAEDEVLVSGMVYVASGLGLMVLAEGVETPEQLARLKSLGCDLAQGNYFSKPLSSEAAERLLVTHEQ